MPKLVPIVEGDGEVTALPVLLRRLLHDEWQRYDWEILQPKNAHGCGGLTTPNGIERFIEYALLEPECDGVLVLIDGDAVQRLPEGQKPESDCSPAFARVLAQRVRALGPRVPVVIVIVRWEYEAWFLSSLESIVGRPIKGLPGLPVGTQFSGEVEGIYNPKGWIEARFPPGRKYSETRDQAAMTSLLDLHRVDERSRSFRRLKNAIQQVIDYHERGQTIVTP